MKIAMTAFAVAALCISALGADNTVVAPHHTANLQSTTCNLKSPEAITIPQMLSYQGKLTDSLGNPVMDTTYSVMFRLYTVPSGGSPFHTETQSVRTRAGLFSALLGTASRLDTIPQAGTLYLGMAVAAGPELVPRQRIVSAAYSFYAGKADTANYALAAPGGGDNAWVHGGDSVLYTIRMLGLAKGGGANALLGPSAWSHVNLGFRCTTGLTGQDRFYCAVGGGRNNVASGLYSTVAGGIKNTASGDDANVAGGSDNTASAYASAVGGGLYNRASGTNSFVGGGYWGAAQGDYSVVGGGRADSAGGIYSGVLTGYSNVAGGDASDTAAVVAGGRDNRATEAYTFVGGGRHNLARGRWAAVLGGEYDSATWTNTVVCGGYNNRAYGEYAAICGGRDNRAGGYGAFVGAGHDNYIDLGFGAIPSGYADTVRANYGFATGTHSVVPPGYTNSAAFNGQTVTASNQTRVGALSKASGTFTIDHPLDPYGMILNHYFIEGPEMRNIYDGEAVLDGSGRAVVTLPGYFDALNRNPRVQVTGVGTSDVYVAQEVSGNRFVIGGKPGTKVFWQVTGERKDVSAEATRRMMPVEQPKTGGLAGRMLDDEFLSGCMEQLVREGKAQGIDFRTAGGRMRYDKTRQATEKQQ